jgi:hypothetical protein
MNRESILQQMLDSEEAAKQLIAGVSDNQGNLAAGCGAELEYLAMR